MKGYIVGFLFTLGLFAAVNETAKRPIEYWQVVVLAGAWPISLGIAAGQELRNEPAEDLAQ